MAELELVGLDQDGEHLVLRGDDGLRFTLPIDEVLRAAVRRDRPQLEQVRTEQSGAIAPREIQARIRSGETAAEIAASADVTVQHVRRFEGPVLAEREYVAEQARTAPVGRDPGAPALGDLVADRLVARGVDVRSLTWDAARDRSGPWVVVARFTAADQLHEARWAFDPSTKALTATEDEARWLSETEITDPPARRHLTAVRPVVFDFAQADVTTGSTPITEATATLLDELGSRRGKRQPLDLDDTLLDPVAPPSVPVPVTPPRKAPRTSPTGTQTSRPAPKTGPTAAVPSAPLPHPEDADRTGTPHRTGPSRPQTGATSTTGATSATGRNRRKGRAKVPSWDEIVFGAKPE